MNKEALVAEMDSFIKEFKSLRDLIINENEEKIKEKMIISTKRRALFDKPLQRKE